MIDLLIAATMSLTVHGASYHLDRDTDYNEQNWGLGVQVDDYRGDLFIDSHGNPAGFVGRVVNIPWDSDFYVGATGGLVHHTKFTGPSVIPHFGWERDGWGFRSMVVPGLDGGAVTLSLTIPITQ